MYLKKSGWIAKYTTKLLASKQKIYDSILRDPARGLATDI